MGQLQALPLEESNARVGDSAVPGSGVLVPPAGGSFVSTSVATGAGLAPLAPPAPAEVSSHGHLRVRKIIRTSATRMPRWTTEGHGAGLAALGIPLSSPSP